jgi:hypothetical protein
MSYYTLFKTNTIMHAVVDDMIAFMMMYAGMLSVTYPSLFWAHAMNTTYFML